jgi:peptidoglycan/LPS O-acetylase OafA/YrhL
LPSLTGMRFIAAAFVFAFHTSIVLPVRDLGLLKDYAHAVSVAGTMGVGFFFVLSGFVLAWTVRQGDTARRFWRRRVAKVYPNHVVTWLAALILMLLAGEAVTVRAALSNLLLVHPWLPQPKLIFSMNDVSWSLACEALFYLAFPLVYRYIARIPANRLWASAAAVAAAIIVLPFFTHLLPDHPLYFGRPIWQDWFIYVLPPVRLLDFVLGILMARIVQTGRWIPLGLGPAAVLVAASYWLSLHVPYHFSIVAAPIISLALVVPAAATADLKGRRSPLRGSVMVWLGEISFAFYLIHRLVMRFAHKPLGLDHRGDTPRAIGVMLGVFAVSLLFSWLLYALIERPAMRWIAGSRPGAERPQAQAPGPEQSKPTPDAVGM